MDWNLVPAFLAVLDEGSLSGAARRLGVSQPTLGRQVRALEQGLGTTLFRRHARGLSPTDEALDLLPQARRMADAAARLARAAESRETALTGTVRITASVFVSHHILPPVVAGIRRSLPELELEIAPSDSSENLLFREADIALRMYRPTQLDVVARHLGDLPLGLFAHRSYLDRRGRPEDPAALSGHDLIGYDRSTLIIDGMRAMGFNVDRNFFGLRCDSQTVYWELVRAGCGIGACQSGVAMRTDGIEQVLPELVIPPLPVWLTLPEPLRHVPRIRAVADALADGLAPWCARTGASGGPAA
ncbi:LysR family transcriptional regulator [Oceanomicrobium pacificus]|nr:LysR family transcriptional regulator [Oceanomicrobium pacificus]